jgi:hypothetical protein
MKSSVSLHLQKIVVLLSFNPHFHLLCLVLYILSIQQLKRGHTTLQLSTCVLPTICFPKAAFSMLKVSEAFFPV